MAENKGFTTADTAYHSISSADNDVSDESLQPKIELGAHPQLRENRSWWATLFWQTFAVLWLLPVIILLYWNFTSHIIGASAWCPDGKCWLDAFNYNSEVPQERMKIFDKDDHDLLGGLQFVAKGLEIWFGVIAAALIYLITMRFAGKKEGLPVGYLTRPMEFADIIGLLDPLLWVTGPSPLGAKSAGDKRLGRRVWQLIALSVFLCILINLMGPATAILVIPSLQWLGTKQIGSRQFSHLNAGGPPDTTAESWVWWGSPFCTRDDFDAKDYSCMQDPFGTSLDAWTASAISYGYDIGYTMQDELTFTTNKTYKASTDNSLEQSNSDTNIYSDVVWWAPSRQIMSNISTDLMAVRMISRGFEVANVTQALKTNSYYPDPIDTYVEYNKSLELQVRRNGPVIGTMMNKYVDYNNDYHSTINIDDNRQVRCYYGYNLWNTQFAEGTEDVSQRYARCIRTGSGWSGANKKTNFAAPGVYKAATKRQGPGVTVEIWSSDRAVFLPNNTLPTWFPESCLNPKKLNGTTCDWNRFFDPSTSPPELVNRTENAVTMEYTMQGGNSSVVMVADFVAFRAFTTYTIDPFPFSNPLSIIQTDNLPDTGTNFAIDPAWLLAGYSTLEGGSLLANRTTTALLLDVMTRLLANPTDGVVLGLSDNDWKIDMVTFLPIINTLTMIDHSTTPVPQGYKSEDVDKPVLTRNARMYVWAYGLGSRTSYLGAAVAIAGVMVVVWQSVLGFFDRRRYRSPTQLVVAALEHAPRGEFEGKQHDEKAMARVRFHIKDYSGHAGKFSFYEPDASEQQPIR